MLRNIYADENGNNIVITNKFGTFNVSLDNEIVFHNGIIGLPALKVYYLLNMPNPNLSGFYLLNAKEDSNLVFLAVPINHLTFQYTNDDMAILASESNTALDDMLVMLITTIHINGTVLTFTANAQAPIVISKTRHTAKQCVLMNDSYQINMKL